MQLGRLLISLSKEDEALIRKHAKEDFGGKKGSIRSLIVAAVHAWIQQRKEQKRRNELADRLMADMREGFHLDLKDGKAYEKREDIYADYFRKKGLY